MTNIQFITALPFPSVDWWLQVMKAEQLYFDDNTIYKKDQPKNRYLLTGSQGKQLLTIPLSGGRNQKLSLEKVKIANGDNWQDQHWKTIKTLYQRSPFFEYYELDIFNFFQQKIPFLNQWNKESIFLINRLLKLNLEFSQKEFSVIYPSKLENKKQHLRQETTVYYHQVFQEKVGFQPNCSILDLLFCEGNKAALLLKS